MFVILLLDSNISFKLFVLAILMPNLYSSSVLQNRKYHVTITQNELSFGFSSGCMQNSVDRSQILEAEEIEHINGFLDWGGYGIRKQLPSWDTGYIARNGPGVRIKIKKSNGKEAEYTFSCHEPAEVVRILNLN